MELPEAFDHLLVWLADQECDEEMSEEFYSFSQGYEFEDVANLLDTTKNFYEKRVLKNG